MNYYAKIKSLLIEATSKKTLRALKTRRGSIDGKPLTFKTKKGYTPPARNVDDQFRTHIKSAMGRHIRNARAAL